MVSECLAIYIEKNGLSSFNKFRILQLRWKEKRAPSIAAVLKWEVFKVTSAVVESAFNSGHA